MKGRAVLALAALVVAGCTAVPSHSSPQTVPFNLQSPTSVPTEHPPPRDASPREIVQDFLDVSADDAGAQSSARDYLTRAVRGSWQDAQVTIVDAISVSNYSLKHHTITVRGREIASVDENGIYSPTNDGTGRGDKITPYAYGIAKIHGQYRIDKLPPGLLLTLDQFTQTYESHALEFFDLGPHYLIPDLRYSPLQGAPLAEWLISQLAAGPRPELQKAVSPGGLSTPGSGASPTVQLADASSGGVTTVAVPGAAAQDTAAKDQLAAQIAQTLVDVVGTGGLLSITDNGKPIKIPIVGSTQFIASQFEGDLGPSPPPAELYYLRDGRVVDEAGKDLTGTGVDGTPSLTSVALTSGVDQDPNSLSVAGIHVSGSSERLYVGTQKLGVYATAVEGPKLTRPAWAPGRSEVWIGAGPTLYRLTATGVAAQRHVVPLPSSPNDAPIQAVRISPDGSRIALVLGQPGFTQLYQAVIIRTAGHVRIGQLIPISPAKVAITDVAWNGPLKLFAIGYLQSDSTAEKCETNVDGSGWSLSLMPGLPNGPDALTVTAHAVAWVEVGNTVWKQNGTTWVSPSPNGFSHVAGSNPVYLE